MDAIAKKREIAAAIGQFRNGLLYDNAIHLFESLGYNTSRRNRLADNTLSGFKSQFCTNGVHFNEDKALSQEWQKIELLFQLTKTEMQKQGNLFDSIRVDNTIIESYLFFAIELKQSSYSRTVLSSITREINKQFDIPAMILFKHGESFTLAIINRRLNKRDESKDVLLKVTQIKDISFDSPHRAHLDILFDLNFDKLCEDFTLNNFVDLHTAWQKKLDTSELNKKFYRELANWYFWACQHVEFPADVEPNAQKRNAVNLIRLITRLMFVWFLKEKGLVPQEFFNKSKLDNLLQYDDKEDSIYYKAILQNLFFATLNQEMNTPDAPENRRFKTNGQQHNITNLYRYRDYFRNPQESLHLFSSIPFLNGGLFECLDRSDKNDPEKIIRLDGFSDAEDNALKVPDFLFFQKDEKAVDLSATYGDEKRKKEKVRGLLHILGSYKFTVTENTPVEEEIALDPELLGRVFENLLASYNPETQTTARKQTGSFYTPREIVNYMVDESLIAYLETKLLEHHEKAGIKTSEIAKQQLNEKLRKLFSYSLAPHDFADAETDLLIRAIDGVKILDPACGSGAFPMGILHKMVYVLSKLDPQNESWKIRQIARVRKAMVEARKIEDSRIREKCLADLRENIASIEVTFQDNELDYGRKLFLIENCIYGVDIQPIAVQIAKLRFFISLIVDQRIAPEKENLGIRPLPNLETKFVAANALIGLEKPGQIMLRNPEIEAKERELRHIRESHFTAQTSKEKASCREMDSRLRAEIAELLRLDGFSREQVTKLAQWDPYDQNASADFFDPEWMFGIHGGFDVVIGNPPYVEHKKLKGLSSKLKKSYATYSGTADLYVYFYESGIKQLKENGVLIFISSNKFIKTSYGKNLRGYFIGYRINEIIDFTKIHVFDALVASCIFSISKSSNTGNKIKVTYVDDRFLNFSSLYEFININKFDLQQKNLNQKIWQLENQTMLLLKEKIEAGSITLKETEAINIYRGVTTGYNPAFIIDAKKRKELVQDDYVSKAIIKPLLQGRNIRKWSYRSSNKYLLQTGYDLNIKKDFQKVFQHLVLFKTQLEVRADQGRNWWNLRACKYYSEFEKEKIVWGLTADKWAFAYDNNNHFLPSNGYILTSRKIHLKFLLALMNSKLMEFYFGFIGIMTAGGAFTLKHQTVSEFPIKLATKEVQGQLVRLVDSILLLIQSTDFLQNPAKQAKVKEYENQIDQKVYRLYGLTNNEINIVQKCTASK